MLYIKTILSSISTSVLSKARFSDSAGQDVESADEVGTFEGDIGEGIDAIRETGDVRAAFKLSTAGRKMYDLINMIHSKPSPSIKHYKSIRIRIHFTILGSLMLTSMDFSQM